MRQNTNLKMVDLNPKIPIILKMHVERLLRKKGPTIPCL